MFRLFFPNNKWFFPSAAAWAILLVVVWFEFIAGTAATYTSDTVWPSRFLSIGYVSYFGYFAAGIGIFYAVWQRAAPGKWNKWAILGSGGIIMATNFSVQVSVVLNDWRGSFYNIVQKALTSPGAVTQYDLYAGIGQFLSLALMSMAVIVLNQFFVRHFVFRWRTAMNEHFVAHWQSVRKIEGASQRIQEDTMRFATIMQNLGVSLVESFMVLIAFLPVLAALSANVTELPVIGAIPHPLVVAAIMWSLLGTMLMVIVGAKLPGLEYKNQLVEAAFRKELVLGEDDEARADPITLAELFDNVRKNYTRMYAHFLYLDVARNMFLQADVVFAYVLLIPTVVVGKITLGAFQQIASAFSQVTFSFQYLVNGWPSIVEVVSIHKRLLAFEKQMRGQK